MRTKLKFKRLQPDEVKIGDIIVIPKKEKGKRNKLHLSPYTMRRHGLMYAKKYRETYKKLFGNPDTTLCIITDVQHKYFRDIDLIKNISNSIVQTKSFKVPIETLCIASSMSYYAARTYLSSIIDIMAELKITEKDLRPLKSKIQTSGLCSLTGIPVPYGYPHNVTLSLKQLYEKVSIHLLNQLNSDYDSMGARLKFLEFLVKQGAYILRPENAETSKYVAMTIYSHANTVESIPSQVDKIVREHIKEIRNEVKDIRKKCTTWKKFYKMYNDPEAIIQALNKVCGIKKESIS